MVDVVVDILLLTAVVLGTPNEKMEVGFFSTALLVVTRVDRGAFVLETDVEVVTTLSLESVAIVLPKTSGALMSLTNAD